MNFDVSPILNDMPDYDNSSYILQNSRSDKEIYIHFELTLNFAILLSLSFFVFVSTVHFLTVQVFYG